MYRIALISLFVSAAVSGGYLIVRDPHPAGENRQSAAAIQPKRVAPSAVPRVTVDRGRYLFNITLHTPEEIQAMLRRAEQLSKRTPALDFHTGIALVLHGPEMEIFAKKNYERYKTIVDLARRLDQDGVIKVKMCQAGMQARGIKEQDVPAFIELVPYGPDEIKRLEREGYVYL